MALKIRLARGGAKKRPYYRVVVAQATAPRDGRFIEKVGTYNPLLPQDHQDRVRLVEDRIKYWLSVGALPTDRVARILGGEKIIPMPTVNESPKRSAPKAKAQERMRERLAAEEAAREAAAAPAPEAPAEEPATEAPAEETPAAE